MTRLQELKSKMQEMKRQFVEESKVLFLSEAKNLFDKNPALESFSWNQYTPYFNDGDECTFSAHVDYPHVNGIDHDDIYYGGSKEENAHLKPLVEEVKKLLTEMDEEVLKDMFGDHCRIVVFKDKIDVESYDHE